jgi:hypothetical protein
VHLLWENKKNVKGKGKTRDKKIAPPKKEHSKQA